MGSTQQFESQLIYRFNLQNSMSVTPGMAHCSVAQRAVFLKLFHFAEAQVICSLLWTPEYSKNE